ncbi:NADH-quinone oxidoreductase subunit L [Pedobacter sp. BS3]|uniref:NADH-quinone oxidoreductase subunit L n=1 Tax=Pedobacter sp. BS3 TaxID=2567937 RepID=UPI0011EE23DC|nr:NADH-quinone oxidoreductase subunit L [Pedobacter sp. BS3]TZF81894.1 NADH-quinone oxidoreductase subunit L [Pedobacter sp. BS3]
MTLDTPVVLTDLAIAAAILPLLSFLVTGLFAKPGKGAFLAILTIAISFILSAIVFSQTWNRLDIHQQYVWFTIGNTSFYAGILLNNLGSLMLLLVSGIALLVHIYSTAYMKGDAYLHRYWAHLSLFCFSMLSMVIADNLLLIYIFWELVGFSSYLLIGFWFTRDAAVQANKKAFIVNRIGDLGILSGLMIVFTQFGTFDLQQLLGENGLIINAFVQNGEWINGVHTMPAVWLTVAGLGFVLGAIAKSAQFPLHVWLPDAMEGPTAVSSLIHAATMVAAGIFLLARLFPLFNDTVLLVIAITGTLTALMAATIALVQNDIKKVLAYSTISQLGFMMLAIGIGQYSAAIFHLTTHAFFKCLLFLSAGAVIHEMHHVKQVAPVDFDHQDIRNMGGLRKHMPVTFIAMLVASLALIGIPLTSGYLSKDAILISSFEWAALRGSWSKIIPVTALITSWLTAFYTARLFFKVFLGKNRWRILSPEGHIHEAPPAMRYPLVILALCSTFLIFSVNPLLYEDAWLLRGFPAVESLERINIIHTVIPALVNLLAILIIYFAWQQYARRDKTIFTNRGFFYDFAFNKWYIDNLYQAAIIKRVLNLAAFVRGFDRVIVDGMVHLLAKVGQALATLSAWLDTYIVDGLVNGVGILSKSIGNFARNMQTGKLQHYLLITLFIVITFFIVTYFSLAI